MRNKNKIFVLISIIVLLLVVGLYLSHKNKKDTYITTQKKRIDLYFKHNLKNYQTMKINNFKKSPMKGYFIDGYINDDKTLEFEAYISSADNHQFTGDIGYDTDGVGKLFKEKNAKDKLTPNDIIKKENLNKNDYEADPPLIWGF
ncbi:DUF1433 domain-containing protein [Staphylococcus haemolyticus]|uniref:DUF1433 domain-containing protein n=1 Tax=Staphylococcus TaxID=1279 RepID=UPI0009479D62|nr:MULTISPECIES: DUF1433 domain-containing protein [Staphylococcus]MCI2934699.1 DUF1433 domain-containing protein [Staphylococcus haemolyticus]OLF65704.1 hypothetical protein BB045_11345 [Staphylococcus sp. MB377]